MVCLSLASQNKKLQNAPANYLLNSLLRVLSYENSPPEDEIPLDGSQDLKKGESIQLHV